MLFGAATASPQTRCAGTTPAQTLRRMSSPFKASPVDPRINFLHPSQHASRNGHIWTPVRKDYQKMLQIVEGATKLVISSLLIQQREPAKSKAELLRSFAELAAQPNRNQQGKRVAMEVLRRLRAKHVLTTNEGLPSHFIRWHNEYAVSPVRPGYLVLFCEVLPDLRGQLTGLVGGIVGGNGLYKASTFGPTHGPAPPGSGREEDGTEGIAIPLHFGGVEKDEIIPMEWLEAMDRYQHEVTSGIKTTLLSTPDGPWKDERKILASFWD
ncbi:hypothetical protein DL767_001225 [Monosporascus sp. MG133]|nr:hypothetical protein DL767_001225 [Monosporascus sp. MG133]